MIVGMMILIVCIIVVSVGTSTTEAEALYYENEYLDADYSVSGDTDDDAAAEDVESGGEAFEQTVTTNRPGTNTTKITVGGADIKTKTKSFKQADPASLDDLASIASAKDPNAKNIAQRKYDKYMGDM